MIQTDKNLQPKQLFEEWIAACATDSPLSSNQPAVAQPFQRWLKFKEAFSPRFIDDCVKEAGKGIRKCIDPFGGSGTTALTCQFLGIVPTTVEVNPFLSDLIEAKLTKYNLERLQQDADRVIADTESRGDVDASRLLSEAPATLVEPGVGAKWVFNADVAGRILSLRQAIDSVRSRANRRLLKVLLGSVLLDVSNVIVNGKGRRYRGNWKERPATPQSVNEAFTAAVSAALEDIERFSERATCEYTLIRGDCRTKLSNSKPADVAIFSPPYPNSFDYTDIYNLELWILGYLTCKKENTRLRKRTLRSHVQIHRPFHSLPELSPRLDRAYAKLGKVRDDLWNPYLPEMVVAYFYDLLTVMKALRKKLRANGCAFIAVGNSQYSGVLVDVRKILGELAPHAGFKVIKSAPMRSMRSSAQQGGDYRLAESLIVVKRC